MGQYNNSGTCEDCPAGSSCPDPAADSPDECSDGENVDLEPRQSFIIV